MKVSGIRCNAHILTGSHMHPRGSRRQADCPGTGPRTWANAGRTGRGLRCFFGCRWWFGPGKRKAKGSDPARVAMCRVELKGVAAGEAIRSVVDIPCAHYYTP